MERTANILDDRLLKVDEILKALRISKSTWYDGVNRGVFPPPVRIGSRNVRWRASDIEKYLQSRYE